MINHKKKPMFKKEGSQRKLKLHLIERSRDLKSQVTIGHRNKSNTDILNRGKRRKPQKIKKKSRRHLRLKRLLLNISHTDSIVEQVRNLKFQEYRRTNKKLRLKRKLQFKPNKLSPKRLNNLKTPMRQKIQKKDLNKNLNQMLSRNQGKNPGEKQNKNQEKKSKKRSKKRRSL